LVPAKQSIATPILHYLRRGLYCIT
jgi:hypothetical protein